MSKPRCRNICVHSRVSAVQRAADGIHCRAFTENCGDGWSGSRTEFATAHSTEEKPTQTPARTNPDLDAHQPRGRLTLTQRRADITQTVAHTAQTSTRTNPEVGCTDPGMGCHDPEWCSHRPRARLPSPRAGLYGPRGWLLQLRPVFSARRELKLLPRQGHTPACP